METPPAPSSIRFAGWLGIIAGLADAVVVVGITLWSANAWNNAAEQTGPEALQVGIVSLWITCGVCLAFALICLIDGSLLLSGRRIGRPLAYSILPLALLTTLGSQIGGQIGKNLAELAMQEAATRSQAVYFQAQVEYLSPTPLFGILAGIAIMILVSQESARAWVARRAAPALPGLAETAPSLPTRQCLPALLSLILAFIPMVMLTQLASIILGIVALHQIRRSGGELSGRWMAVTGIVTSSILWLFILLVLGWILYSELNAPHLSVAEGT